MPRLSDIIASTADPLTLIILHWTAIVGRRSHGLLFPRSYDPQKKTLRVAVPNSMVRAQYEPLLPLIVEKMAKVTPGTPVEKIALVVEPRHFERIRCRRERETWRPIEPDPEQVALAEQRLAKKGIPPRVAAALARIAVILEQRRHADR